MNNRSLCFRKLFLLFCLCWIFCCGNGEAEERMLGILEPLRKYGTEPKTTIQAQLQKYQQFHKGIQKIMEDTQDDPQGALEELKFNGTINGLCYVPQICGNQKNLTSTDNKKQNIIHRKGLSRSDEEESDESNENVIQEREPRQDLTPATLFPFIGLLNFLAIAPILVANLAMTFVSFGLSVSSLSDGNLVTDLHQTQLNTLAGYAGIPAAVVNPAADGAPGTRNDDTSSSHEVVIHSKKKPMRQGLPYSNQNGIIERTRQDLDEFIHKFGSMTFVSKSIAILVIGGTLIAISLGLSLFGPVNLFLSFVFLAIPLLTGTGTILGFLNPQSKRKSRATVSKMSRRDLNSRILLYSGQLNRAKLKYI